MWVNLQLMVKIQEWEKVKDSERKRTNFLDRMGYSKKLSEIEFGIKELRSRHSLTKESLEKLIRDIVYVEVREKLIHDKKISKDIEERKRKDVKGFVKSYVEGIVNGEILNNKGIKYTVNSIKSWTQFRRLFLDCYKNMSFTWDELTQPIVQKFLIYLDKNRYMAETKNRHIGVFSTLITVSEKQKLHNNGIARKWLKTVPVTDYVSS